MKLNKDIFSMQYQKYLRIKKIFEAGDVYTIILDIFARFNPNPLHALLMHSFLGLQLFAWT